MPNFQLFLTASNALNQIPMEQLVERAADRQEGTMVDLNVEQMDQGIRSDSSKIEPPYRPYTISRKKKVGQPTDRVTLKDTGDFHNSVRIKRYPKQYELFAYDSKSEALQEKYGYRILGLTNFNMQKIKQLMKPFLIKDIRNVLKIK